MQGSAPLFEVVPAGDRVAAAPSADVSLTLRNYTIAISRSPAAGHRTFRVENRGPSMTTSVPPSIGCQPVSRAVSSVTRRPTGQ